ncbi:hypothetical protein [Streptomyces sp. ADI92-24]|nr:hypothetical protein [Streptomyces sp. ADI92-24]
MLDNTLAHQSVEYEAAEHAARQQVFDPLVRHFSGGRHSAF